MIPSTIPIPSRIIDLTHPLRPGQGTYPGDPAVCFRPYAELTRDGYRLAEISLGTHSGTHADAPSHFVSQGATIDQWPLETLVGTASVVDVPGKAGVLIGPELLGPHQQIFHPGARILFRTGWEVRYGTDEYWRGYPSLTPEAARWIAQRGVVLVGFDTPGPAEEPTEVHKILLGGGSPVVIVESLVNLGKLPAQFFLVVAPLKLAGLDGAPARVFAMV